MRFYTVIIISILTCCSCQNSDNSSLRNNQLVDSKNPLDTVETWKENRSISDTCNIELKLIEISEGISQNDLNHKYETPFNVRKVQQEDTLFIYFSFVSSCCQKFKKHIELKDKSLFLDYENSNGRYCDCLGKYDYLFKIQGSEFDKLYLNDLKIQ